MEVLINQLTERQKLLKICIKNNSNDKHPDWEVITGHADELRAVTIALDALHSAQGVGA